MLSLKVTIYVELQLAMFAVFSRQTAIDCHVFNLDSDNNYDSLIELPILYYNLKSILYYKVMGLNKYFSFGNKHERVLYVYMDVTSSEIFTLSKSNKTDQMYVEIFRHKCTRLFVKAYG